MSEYETSRKQAYLREHISESMHDDFGEFCQGYAGNLDIDAWSFDYVEQLVQEFRRVQMEKMRKSSHEKPTSFYAYQTGKAEDIKKTALDVLEMAQKAPKAKIKQVPNEAQAMRQAKETQVRQGMKPQVVKMEQIRTINPGSGGNMERSSQMNPVQLLDSAFEKQKIKKEEKQVVKLINKDQYKTIGKQEQTDIAPNKYDTSFFESNNFWHVPGSTPERKTPSTLSGSKSVESFNFQKEFQSGLYLEPKQAPSLYTTPRNTDAVLEPSSRSSGQGFHSKTPEPNQKPERKISGGAKEERRDSCRLPNKGALLPKVPYEGAKLVRDVFNDAVPCFKSLVRPILMNADVSIVSYEIISRRFLAKDYVMYNLKITPSGGTCKRNYEDFGKLRENLMKVYPGVRLPFLEKIAGWLEAETTPQNIKKQKINLQYFINDLLRNRELRNSRLLEDFLTLKEHKQIKRKFEEYQKITTVSTIEELCLLDGEVHVEISEKKRLYCAFMDKYQTNMEGYFAQQKKLLEDILEGHKLLASNYASLASVVDQISKEVKDFNRRVTTNQIADIDIPFKWLHDFLAQGSENNKYDAIVLEDSLLPFVKYEKESMHEIQSGLRIQNDLFRAYQKRKDGEREGEGYFSNNLKQFKTSVLEESKNITVLKYQCGYMTNQCCNDAQKYFDSLGTKLTKLVDTTVLNKTNSLVASIARHKNILKSIAATG